MFMKVDTKSSIQVMFTHIHSFKRLHARRWTALIHSSHIAYLPA